MTVLSVAVFLSVVLMAFLLGGELSMFINVPSLLIVLPPAMLFACAATSKQVFTHAFGFVIDTERATCPSELELASRVFCVMGNTAMWMGWFGVISGAIAMASHITSEEFADIFGPATAVCLLTLLYAVIIKALSYLAEKKLQFAAEFLRKKSAISKQAMPSYI